MKERPILFSESMVLAITEGRKTQTRRAVKFPLIDRNGSGCEIAGNEITSCLQQGIHLCPYGTIGDRLWVKETHAFYALNFNSTGKWHPIDPDICAHYRAGVRSEIEERINRWRPSIHMPRWASRITLEITNVRVERLQKISEEDAVSEGFPGSEHPNPPWSPLAWFEAVWMSINGEQSWKENPWVWVVEFKRLEK